MSVDALALGGALVAALALAAIVLALVQLSRRRGEAIVERIEGTLDPVMAPAVSYVPLAPDANASPSGGWIGAVLGRLSGLARPARKEEIARIRTRLQRGGFRGEHALSAFLGSKVVLAFSLLAIALWLQSHRADGASSTLLLGIVACAIGFYGPDAFLSSRIRSRQTAIERGLPDSLDLLVTCVEAGLGLDAALQRVAAEVELAWPLLGSELKTTFLEVKAGIPRVEAFRRLAHRTGVKELKSLAATLTQTETFGTSVALALRIQAEGIRTKRMQKAEERAGYASVKMTIPLVVCILPSLMAIVGGPAVVSIVKNLPALTRSR